MSGVEYTGPDQGHRCNKDEAQCSHPHGRCGVGRRHHQRLQAAYRTKITSGNFANRSAKASSVSIHRIDSVDLRYCDSGLDRFTGSPNHWRSHRQGYESRRCATLCLAALLTQRSAPTARNPSQNRPVRSQSYQANAAPAARPWPRADFAAQMYVSELARSDELSALALRPQLRSNDFSRLHGLHTVNGRHHSLSTLAHILQASVALI